MTMRQTINLSLKEKTDFLSLKETFSTSSPNLLRPEEGLKNMDEIRKHLQDLSNKEVLCLIENTNFLDFCD